jgi:alpha-mannosidase
VVVTDDTLANGVVTVEVDDDTGTFSVDGIPGFGRLVDDGDHGDTYNWSPPDTDLAVDAPESVTVEVEERGPLLGRLAVVRRYQWPEEVRSHSRVGSLPVDVRTTLELRVGEPFVRVTLGFENRHRDHRVRVWLPLPEPAARSRSECAFAVVERGLTAEGGPSETGIPTYPSRRFVEAGGLTVAHEGLNEYELVDLDEGGDHARALALTVLRATGMLSRVEMTTRPLSAGPPDPLEGAQMQGPHRVRFAVQVGPCDPYGLADAAFVPLRTTIGTGAGTLSPRGHLLEVSGAEVSSVRRHDGGLEVRVFNPTPEPARVELGPRTGWLVDLRGRPLEAVEGAIDLAPWQIATVRLCDEQRAEASGASSAGPPAT